MRELKFRAFLKKEQKMTNVLRIDLKNQTIDHLTQDLTLGECGISFDDMELMQFTGTYDWYGKPIFEGDIIKNLNGDLIIVNFKNGAFIAGNFFHNGLLVNDKTIVGNIYENSEFLRFVKFY
jgi:hypothetical protein